MKYEQLTQEQKSSIESLAALGKAANYLAEAAEKGGVHPEDCIPMLLGVCKRDYPELFDKESIVYKPKSEDEKERLSRELFNTDVRITKHKRYGKSATWDNYKHPGYRAYEISPKTFWYAYETASGKIAVKFSTQEGVFGPNIHCYLDHKNIEVEKYITFEAAVYKFWSLLEPKKEAMQTATKKVSTKGLPFTKNVRIYTPEEYAAAVSDKIENDFPFLEKYINEVEKILVCGETGAGMAELDDGTFFTTSCGDDVDERGTMSECIDFLRASYKANCM